MQYRGRRLTMEGYSRQMVATQLAEDTAAKRAEWLGLPIPMIWRKVGRWLQSAGVAVLAVVLLPYWIGRAELRSRRRDPRTLAELMWSISRSVEVALLALDRPAYIRYRQRLRRRAVRLIRRGLQARTGAVPRPQRAHAQANRNED